MLRPYQTPVLPVLYWRQPKQQGLNMAECSYRMSRNPEYRCSHPTQEGKDLCRWHDPNVQKTKADVRRR